MSRWASRVFGVMELVERAVLDLNAPPDRGVGVQQSNLELVKGIRGRVGAGAPVMLDDVRGGVEDVPQRVLLPCAEGMPNRHTDLLVDHLQLGQAKLNCPQVAVAQPQPVSKHGGDFGDHPALGLGELDRDTQFGFLDACHGVSPFTFSCSSA